MHRKIFFGFYLGGCLRQLVNALYYMTENLRRLAVGFQFIVHRDEVVDMALR